MTAAGPQHSGSRKSSHVQGWVVSLLLHGTVVLGAILLVKQIQLAPQEKPFKWDVSLVSPTKPVTPESSPPEPGSGPACPRSRSAADGTGPANPAATAPRATDHSIAY